MKMFLTILLVTSGLFLGHSVVAGEFASFSTNAPACLELRDQFDRPQKLSFPTTNLTLLTIADKKGSKQIAGWVVPVEQRFGGRIVIRGIADVSSVPGPLRGIVRKKFQKLQAYPVMMDWSGVAVKAFVYVPGKADILVLDSRGRILRRVTGEANDRAVQDLCGSIEHALAGRKFHTATK